jgi:Glycosyl transferase family 4
MLYSYFYVAFVCGAGATWLSIAFARRHGFISRPNPIVPQHTSAVAHLGGVGILLGAATTFSLFLLLGRAGFQPSTGSVRLPLPYAVGAVLFLTLGVFDDLLRLNAATKFLLQVLAAALALQTGLTGSFTGVRAADAALSALLILTLVNAVNFTDVCDGLVGGLAVVMLPFLARGDADSFALALIFAGACAGFLVFNLPPAKTFLGDVIGQYPQHSLAVHPGGASFVGRPAHGVNVHHRRQGKEGFAVVAGQPRPFLAPAPGARAVEAANRFRGVGYGGRLLRRRMGVAVGVARRPALNPGRRSQLLRRRVAGPAALGGRAARSRGTGSPAVQRALRREGSPSSARTAFNRPQRRTDRRRCRLSRFRTPPTLCAS